MQSEIFVDIVSENAMVKNDNECRKLIVEAINYRLPSHMSDHHRCNIRIRRKYGQVTLCW